MLRRWGHARGRRVRDHRSTTLPLRPRRARRVTCGVTQVLLLDAVLPRRADTTAVIGTAVLTSARGVGYRRVTAQIGCPVSTVRRWVRSVRGSHIEWLPTQSVAWIHTVDREVLATLTTAPTRLDDALTSLAAAALAVRARLTPHVPTWTVIGRLTHWRLVPTSPRRLKSHPDGFPHAHDPPLPCRQRRPGHGHPAPQSRRTPPEMPDSRLHRQRRRHRHRERRPTTGWVGQPPAVRRRWCRTARARPHPGPAVECFLPAIQVLPGSAQVSVGAGKGSRR